MHFWQIVQVCKESKHTSHWYTILLVQNIVARNEECHIILLLDEILFFKSLPRAYLEQILVNVCKSQGSPQGCVNILKEVLMRLSPALSPNTHFKVQNFQNIKKCILRTPHSPNTLFKLIIEIIPNEYFSHLSKHCFQS